MSWPYTAKLSAPGIRAASPGWARPEPPAPMAFENENALQTSATGACSLIAECSLYYAKIYIIISPSKRFDIKAYARPCRTGRLAGQYGPFGGAIRHVSGCETAPMANTLATNRLAIPIFFRYDMATGIAGGPDCNMPRQPPAQNGSGGTQPSQVVSHRPVCHSPKPAGSVTSRPPAA